MDEKIYEDAVCIWEDGKWKCELYKEPLFRPVSPKEIKPITLVTPEGVAEVEPHEVMQMVTDRKKDIVFVDGFRIYNAWVVETKENYLNRIRIEITPSNSRIMRCKVYEEKTWDKNKRILHCFCEEAVMIKG